VASSSSKITTKAKTKKLEDLYKDINNQEEETNNNTKKEDDKKFTTD
jgi:hypothetical protein